MWWFTSPKIAFGEDSLEQLSAIEGKRVLVITDTVVSRLGMLELVMNELKKQPRAIEVFDQVEAEPSFENVEKAAAAASCFQPDLIVALGGGSWDPITGHPTEERLRALGIESLSAYLPKT